MRLAVLMMCTLLAAGVFAALSVAIWSSRRDAAGSPSFSHNLAADLVWAAIPCLMILAAAIPAAIAIAISLPGH